jgi:sterol desaturase/sphingolipid hydroxylase (fatty acid hydroxylase superfamily)
MASSFISTIFSTVFSLCKGVLIGGSVYMLGNIMDKTISAPSLEYFKKTDPDLYSQSQMIVFNNLLTISPFAYILVDKYILYNNRGNPFSFIKLSILLVCQNIGYFFAHREMHRNKHLHWIHVFHHRFEKKMIIPSIANAVTPAEFILAYVSPIVLGAYILQVSQYEFIATVEIISVLNLLIHTYELNDTLWIPGLVSPKKHIEHHRVRDKHYSAPLLDLDQFDSSWVITES